jgi:hypothetical protein
MKKFLMIGAAAASALAVPAGAQVTGTINITGTVASRCAVVGGATPTTFTDNVNLGELAQANGTLESSATLASRFISTNSGSAPAFRVVCNSANPAVAVDATELTTAGTASTGYTNRIDYSAHVTVNLASGTTATVNNSTTTAATGATALGAPISGAAGNNVTVTADTFSTPGGATTLLVAGTYNGAIVVTVTPS